MTTAPRRLRAEVWIVLGLSLGQSAVYAVVSLVLGLLSATAGVVVGGAVTRTATPATPATPAVPTVPAAQTEPGDRAGGAR